MDVTVDQDRRQDSEGVDYPVIGRPAAHQLVGADEHGVRATLACRLNAGQCPREAELVP
jgi:hypothetical protein